MGMPPQATHTTGGGSVLIPLVLIAVVAWFFLQFRPHRRDVWADRWGHPLITYFMADLEATWKYILTFNIRGLAKPSWWRERLQFKKLWQSYEKF